VNRLGLRFSRIRLCTPLSFIGDSRNNLFTVSTEKDHDKPDVQIESSIYGYQNVLRQMLPNCTLDVAQKSLYPFCVYEYFITVLIRYANVILIVSCLKSFLIFFNFILFSLSAHIL